MSLFHAISERCLSLRHFAQRFVSPLLFLGIRLWIANIFFTDGRLKLGYALHNQTATLYALFEEYKVPFLPVKMAAWLCVGGELTFSVLLAIGFFARCGAVGLFIIAAVIHQVSDNPAAIYWVMLCAIFAIHGPGRLALDAITWKKDV